MERFKENIKSQKEQNLVSSVLMVCFLIFGIFVWGAFSLDLKSGKEMASESQKVLVTLGN